MKIPQMEPWFGKEETKAMTEYLNQQPGPWLTEYKKTEQLERLIADYVGTKYCTMVSNGTVSLIAIMEAMDIGAGDIVIVPDYTMFATATAATILGARVEFVDVEKETLCMDYNSFVSKCEKIAQDECRSVSALILVSINGRYPILLPEILEYCHTLNIPIIEDAAQSLGSFHQKQHVGTYGEVASFSFSTPKIISMGQGGCVITNNKELDDRIKIIKNFGRKDPGVDSFETMGWNFKFTDLQAVIGIEQMKKLPERVIIKRNNYKMYRECLEDNEKIEFVLTNLKNTTPWMNDILLRSTKDRTKVLTYLAKEGIGSRPFYPTIHTTQPYIGCHGELPNSTSVSERGLWLPSSSKLTFEDIEMICSKTEESLK